MSSSSTTTTTTTTTSSNNNNNSQRPRILTRILNQNAGWKDVSSDERKSIFVLKDEADVTTNQNFLQHIKTVV